MWQQSRYKITNNNSYELKKLILSLWAINKKTTNSVFLKFQHYDATYGNNTMISLRSISCRVVLLSIHLKRLFCGKITFLEDEYKIYISYNCKLRENWWCIMFDRPPQIHYKQLANKTHYSMIIFPYYT